MTTLTTERLAYLNRLRDFLLAPIHDRQEFTDAAVELSRLIEVEAENVRLHAEVQRLRLLTFCGCGDQFTPHDPGTCGACVAGMRGA